MVLRRIWMHGLAHFRLESLKGQSALGLPIHPLTATPHSKALARSAAAPARRRKRLDHVHPRERDALSYDTPQLIK